MLKSPLKREGFFLSGGFSAPAVGFLPPGLEENVQQRNNNQTGRGTQKHSVKYRNADGDTAGGTGPGGHNHRHFALYVQTPAESTERIPLATQRHLLNHFKLVTELGGEVIQVSSSDIMGEIIKTCRQRGITTVCMGHPAFKMPGALFSLSKYRKFLHSLAEMDIDLIILA